MNYSLHLFVITAALVISLPGLTLAQQVESLADPIPGEIPEGDIEVALKSFLQFPQTQDAATDGRTNNAHARLQYMYPVPDGSGRVVVNDLRGLLYISDETGRAPSIYLDLRQQDVGFYADSLPNEMGLMGFAFHPQFGNPGSAGYGKFYLSYTAHVDSGEADYLEAPDNDHEAIVMEWTADDHASNIFSGRHREIFRIGQFASNHSIGNLAFNPAAVETDADFGNLYFSLGDGGGANDPMEFGQSLTTPMAAISRINPVNSGVSDYEIPHDNPFINMPEAAPEIWAFGLRHAQHFSFSRDGTMFINDIGQSQIEEVNIGVAGGNYGWRLREGTFATAFGIGNVRPNPVYPRPVDNEEYVYPVAQYDHTPSNAISSGFLYEGSEIPVLRNKYIFTDMVTGHIYYIDARNLEPDSPAEIRRLRVFDNDREMDVAAQIGFPNTYARGNRSDIRLGIDSQGELYLISKGDGQIRRMVSLD